MKCCCPKRRTKTELRRKIGGDEGEKREREEDKDTGEDKNSGRKGTRDRKREEVLTRVRGAARETWLLPIFFGPSLHCRR